ncbi:MAG: tyrosine-type recombinase/integrase [Candidatus Schekmanbacteria bacterium]|nr:tyrosine-type recombinase/integrase [Candidatus Schekmanbacteria bacterium]
MAIRQRPDRQNRWQIDWKEKGKRCHYLLPTKKAVYAYDEKTGERVKSYVPITRTEAEAWHKEKIESLKTAPKNLDTLKDTIPKFLDWAKNHRRSKTVQDYQVALKPLLSHFGELKLSDINYESINSYKTWRLSTVSVRLKRPVGARRVNCELCYLSGIFTWLKKNKIIFAKPEIELLPYNRKLPDVPNKPDIDKLLEAFDGPYRLIFKVMYYTGLRSHDLRHLRWEYINFERKTIQAEVKGGRVITIPISQAIINDLREHHLQCKRPVSGWVFISPKTGKPYDNFRKAIGRAKKRAGLEYLKITPHMMRHAVATHLVDLGVDIRTIQMILGHKDVTTTQIYADVAAEHLINSIDKLGSGCMVAKGKNVTSEK